ncbi:MAG TPA: RusA family crossover junction endodeoxyribonuclease [Terriglobales bacterium]|nr:RusA family crossover junction endodeoxyribonuclease [Terriglobales bacterium]
MKIDLTYDGLLLSSTDKHARVKNKNQIRFDLDKQLYEVWLAGSFKRFQLEENHMYEAALQFGDIVFVPLLARKMNASCRLEIQFLRTEHAGEITHGGDLDNRMKTLLDALRLPQNDSEIVAELADQKFGDERPCVCLLEDDALVTELIIRTRRIMKPMPKNHVRLVISAEFNPSDFER